MSIKKGAQSMHPVEFKRVFLRTDHLAVGDINIDYVYSREACCEQTRLRGFIIIWITAPATLANIASEDCHSVVRLLAKTLTMIASFAKYVGGKLIIRTLRLLHAQHIRLVKIEPAR